MEINGICGSTHLLNVEVRHSNRSHLGLGEVDHGLPCVNEGNAVINFDISVRKVLSLHKREQDVTRLECDWPVDQVELCRGNSSQPLVSSLTEEGCRRIHTSR